MTCHVELFEKQVITIIVPLRLKADLWSSEIFDKSDRQNETGKPLI